MSLRPEPLHRAPADGHTRAADGRVAVVTAYIVTGMLVALAWPDAAAHAQPRGADEFVFQVPPAPAKAKPQLAFEVHTGFSAPLDHSSLCPPDAGCVMNNGGGFGATVELRWPVGLGLMGGYDLWFLDTDSVYELGLQQLLRGGLRYTMPTNFIFHPLIEFGAGCMVYGDTFEVATVGVVLQPILGAEVELTEAVGLRVGLGVRVFSHRPFRTERDGVLRGDDGTFSTSFYFELGLTFL